ncbi:hypothetical protein EDC01DRAFT_635413 [Geopyxis carbonaria]|nr:hypothetical protein EDC01DRAFT_635413 [Geopyxis carbonaria]
MPRNTLKRVSSHKAYKGYTTPQKARLQGAIYTLDMLGIDYIKADIFKQHGFSHAAGYAALREWKSATASTSKDAPGENEAEDRAAGKEDGGEREPEKKKGKRAVESLTDDAARRIKSSTRRVETRGRKKKITKEQVERMREILERNEREGRPKPSWKALASEAGVGASENTVRRAILNLKNCYDVS